LRTNKQLLLIDTNLRLESPLLNLKVRRAVLNQGLNVYSFGFQSDSLYPVYNLGSNTGSLVKFFEGRHALSRVVMNAPQSGLLLFYSHLAIRGGKGSLLASFFKSIRRLASFKLNAHYLIHSISTFGLLDMVGGSSSIVSAKAQSKKSILWCLGEDEVCFDLKNYNTVVYSGHHGDRNAAHATFLIPTLAPFEKNAHFVNILGVSRNSAFAVNGPHLALSEEFFAYTFRLYVNSLLFSRSANSNLEERSSSASVMVQFGFTNSFNEGSFTSSFFDEGKYLDYSSVINENSIDNSVSYYSDNAIVRASHVMALAQSRFKRYKTNFHS
jgi:NADH dehydrogenase/NADH:ubiquinone oxidoreductase subunit G